MTVSSRGDYIYALLGDSLRLIGIGTTMYGIITKDMETIIGGFALMYGGHSMNKQPVDENIALDHNASLNRIADGIEKLIKN